MQIETNRLRLCVWEARHAAPFAAMLADAEVMRDQGGGIARADADAKRARYAEAFAAHGFGRWAVETRSGAFVGYVGVMPSWPGHPLGPHHEIGWRLVRAAWGQGYASEAARAALADAFARCGLEEVLAYTGPDNARSQSVMARLGLQRDAARDFTAAYPGLPVWRGLVWAARAP